MEKEKKAALYTRVSTVHQVDKDSLPHQKHALVEYTKYVLHIENYEIFEDAGFSGKDTNRPAFQAMMTRIRAGEFTHLVVNKIDRISRNLLDFAAMYEELKKCNVTFVSCNEQFDTSSAMGEAMLKIILVFAELERHMTSERVTSVMIDRAKKGKWNGANVPLGYHWSEEAQFPEIDEEEAKIVKMMYRKYLSGESTQRLSAYLNSHKIKTKRGGTWTSTTVSQILHNPFYKGLLRYNYRNAARGSVKPKDEWVIIEHNHPALIDEKQWDATQEMLKKRKRGGVGHSAMRYIHVFSDIMYCLCGYREYSKRDKIRVQSGYAPSYYECSNHRTRAGTEDVCDNNASISDMEVGTFVLTYMRNMIEIQQHIQSYLNRADMEHRLLHGSPFSDVEGIAAENMESIYANFLREAHIDYQPQVKTEDGFSVEEREQLERERSKHKRALERLHRAYLYDDAGILDDIFQKELKEIQKALSAVEAKLKKLDEKNLPATGDTAFLKQASDYLIRKTLLSDEPIDWVDLAMHVDDDALRQFFLTVLRRIVTYKGKIVSIEFQNGIQHRFLYKD